MGLLDGFKKLLGGAGQVAQGVERQLNPFDGGATYNNPRPQAQKPIIDYARPIPQIPKANFNVGKQLPYMNLPGENLTQNVLAQKYGGYTPANGPWAVGSPIPSFMGQRYADNPEAPEFRGVDPMVFGYGPDGGYQIPNVRDIEGLRKYNFYPKVINRY